MDSESLPGRVTGTVAEGIGWLKFDNQRRMNAISLEMWEDLTRLLEAFRQRDDVRVVVLHGAGERAFVSGADIGEFDKERAAGDGSRRYAEAGARAFEALESFPKPTLAMIRGYCIGGGLAVAVCCDMRIAAEDASFSIPAAKLGIGYQVSGIKRLLDLTGPAFTKEIMFRARRFDARTAFSMGLLNKVVPVDRLSEEALEAANDVAHNAPLSIVAAKLAVDELCKDPQARDFAACEAAIEACMSSEDFAEGRRAFREKRAPRFTGR